MWAGGRWADAGGWRPKGWYDHPGEGAKMHVEVGEDSSRGSRVGEAGEVVLAKPGKGRE